MPCRRSSVAPTWPPARGPSRRRLTCPSRTTSCPSGGHRAESDDLGMARCRCWNRTTACCARAGLSLAPRRVLVDTRTRGAQLSKRHGRRDSQQPLALREERRGHQDDPARPPRGRRFRGHATLSAGRSGPVLPLPHRRPGRPHARRAAHRVRRLEGQQQALVHGAGESAAGVTGRSHAARIPRRENKAMMA